MFRDHISLKLIYDLRFALWILMMFVPNHQLYYQMSKDWQISKQMRNQCSIVFHFRPMPRFLLNSFKNSRLSKSATSKYSYEKDDFPLNVTIHLIFFWPATILYPKLKFGMTKSADLDLHRSFFRNQIEFLEAEICRFFMLQLTWDTLYSVT